MGSRIVPEYLDDMTDWVLLVGLVVAARRLTNQWEPGYPAALKWLPLAGSLSVSLAMLMLALLVASYRSSSSPRRKRTGWCPFMACSLAFVPFLHYWNLLGLSLQWGG